MSKTQETVEHTWLDTFTMVVSALVLVAFTALSCYLNQVYAVAESEDVAYHVALPILALGAGIFAEVIFLSNVHRTVRWLTGTLVSVGFAAVMLASYLAVLGVAEAKYPTFPTLLIYVLAAFPDGFMVIAATVILALRVRRTKLRGAVTKTSTKPARGGFARRLAEAATARAEVFLTPPPPRSTEPANPKVEPVEEARGGLEPAPVEPTVETPTSSVEPTVEAENHSTKPSAKPQVGSPREGSVEEISPAVEVHLEEARRLLGSGAVTRKTPVEVARIIAEIERGETTNAIKGMGLGSASTIDKIRKAVDTNAEEPSPALSAVG